MIVLSSQRVLSRDSLTGEYETIVMDPHEWILHGALLKVLEESIPGRLGKGFLIHRNA